MAIDEQNNTRPFRYMHVVVPTTKLREAWIEPGGYIETFGFVNVEVFVVNTYITQKRECALLILDEYHRYGAETFSQIFETCKYKFLLGLTATLEREDGMHKLLLEKAPLIGVVTQEECEREGYISKKKTFNVSVTLNEIEEQKLNELNELFNTSIKKFGQNVYKDDSFNIAMGCSKGKYNKHSAYIKAENTRLTMDGPQWRMWWANKCGWTGVEDHVWSPKNIQKYAGMFNHAMTARKELLYKAENKYYDVLALINKFPNKKIMVFGERTDFLDNLTIKLNANGIFAKALHSNINGEIRSKADLYGNSKVLAIGRKIEGKIKYIDVETNVQHGANEAISKYPNCVKIAKLPYEKEVLSEFREGNLNVLVTANAFDEGIDIPGVEIIIITSGKGVRRQQIQREGRGLRFIEDKVAMIINLFVKDSQEESWLKQRLDTDMKRSYFVDNVNDVSLDYKGFELC